MEAREELADFALLGGPLHRLGCRIGLVRGGSNTVPLGLVLGALTWTVLLALALAELSNSVAIVREMRLVPSGPSLPVYLAVAALLPLLPLVLFTYPRADLLVRCFGRLSGL